MLDKVIKLLKTKPFYIPEILIKNYRKLNISDSELILLIYLINTTDVFNPKQIAKDLNFKLNEVMEIFNSLIEKNIIKIDIINKSVREEIINLDELYNKLAFVIVNDKTKESSNLFDVFEKEFGRTLSPMDYELITDWQKDFDDKLILLALKEAVFNNVTNLRYIDKIIRDWSKKGIKSKEDIIKDKKNYESKKSNKKLFDYDWLNERDS